jgi:predicted N-acetyltransferase YhbS
MAPADPLPQNRLAAGSARAIAPTGGRDRQLRRRPPGASCDEPRRDRDRYSQPARSCSTAAMGPRPHDVRRAEKLRRGRRAGGRAGLLTAKDGDGAARRRRCGCGTSTAEGGAPALLLGPLAVDAGRCKSAGHRLRADAARRSARRLPLGHGAILLVGDAPYYARFGFTAEPMPTLPCPALSSASASSASSCAMVRSRARAACSRPRGRSCRPPERTGSDVAQPERPDTAPSLTGRP